MTPSLFDLPVRTGEAAELANLVVETAGDKVLTEDTRQRAAAQARMLTLESIRPHFASMERDPIHSSALYLACDGLDGQPLLLRIAPASTPSSGLFPKSILIGRVRGPRGAELVINAIPFGPGERDAVKVFATDVNPAFQPRPAGNRSALIVETNAPETAFEAFRVVLKARSLNVAGVADAHLGMWGAIRTGWREGWVTADAPRVRRLISDNAEEIIAAAQQMTP
ncbi:MAG: hypothetical protein M3Z09_09935 [Acidobacteriota bacterium]|nr:hypothetical protein [Acidobacteriota bacterium]